MNQSTTAEAVALATRCQATERQVSVLRARSYVNSPRRCSRAFEKLRHARSATANVANAHQTEGLKCLTLGYAKKHDCNNGGRRLGGDAAKVGRSAEFSRAILPLHIPIA